MLTKTKRGQAPIELNQLEGVEDTQVALKIAGMSLRECDLRRYSLERVKQVFNV